MPKAPPKKQPKKATPSPEECEEIATLWQAVKLASIKGMDDNTLANKFGLRASQIRSKRYRDKEWSSLVQFPRGRITGRFKTINSEKAAETVSKVYENTMEEIADRNTMLLADLVYRKIKQTADDDLVQAPENWSELSTAAKLLRNLTGQDKPEAQVQISLFGGYSVGGQGVRDV